MSFRRVILCRLLKIPGFRKEPNFRRFLPDLQVVSESVLLWMRA